MKLYAQGVDLICCKTVKSEKYGERTYGKLYEDGRLSDFVSDVPLEDVRDVDAEIIRITSFSVYDPIIFTHLIRREYA